MTLRRLYAGCLLFTLAGLLGCGGSSAPPTDPTHDVSGTVTLDGAPLAKGTIRFESEADLQAGVPAGSAEIVAGKYSLSATAGKKQVKILAPVESGPPDATGLVPTKETIPARYNVSTQLSEEVSKDKSNVFNFDLKSS